MVFIHANIPFKYYSETEFTKLMYIGGGGEDADRRWIRKPHR
jgi:hypothetical protein